MDSESKPTCIHIDVPEDKKEEKIRSKKYRIFLMLGIVSLLFLFFVVYSQSPRTNASLSQGVRMKIENVKNIIFNMPNFKAILEKNIVKIRQSISHAKRMYFQEMKVVRKCKLGKPFLIKKKMTCSQVLVKWYSSLAPKFVRYNGGSPCIGSVPIFPKGTQLCIP